MRRLLPVLAMMLTPVAQAAELVVYSARAESLIKPIFERYERERGIKIRYLTDKEAPLIERLRAEGRNTPADLLLTVDAGNLWQAAELGLLRPLQSATLAANIPEHLRDPEGRWYGLSVRARTIVYARDRVQPSDLDSYAALADGRWRGRLCLRTSKKVYNQSLVAMMIAELGMARTEQIVRGWVANLAAPPFASDNEVMDAIVARRCDVGIVNTYYFGRLLREKPELELALFWPDQGENGRGVHVNVSGAGVTRHAKHPQAAQALLEWLSAGPAQHMFAALNLEYPANPDVPPDPAVAAWGSFRQNPINVAQAGALQAEAVKLMDRVGYR
ncbi:iron(III) transport system substrate-binding protein [Fontimonas thermophila]|uniref:Iron(III) transport system substrate-binding protein n=2 Tax=Fontimonas thermophila TaxID=1076937 RepID=A0A1I2JF54_9GAMM|nr:iron(III) transport system substrate-binding protein [Fontimonas thermophila]